MRISHRRAFQHTIYTRSSSSGFGSGKAEYRADPPPQPPPPEQTASSGTRPSRSDGGTRPRTCSSSCSPCWCAALAPALCLDGNHETPLYPTNPIWWSFTISLQVLTLAPRSLSLLSPFTCPFSHCPHSPSSFLLPRLLPSYLLPETLVCPPPAHFSFVSLCALLPLQQPLSLRHSLPLPTCILPVGASRHGPVGLHIYSRKVNETDPNSSGIWKGSRRAFIFQNSVTFRKTYESRSSGRSRARSNRLRALSSAPRNPRSFGCSSQSANLQIRRPGASRIPARPCSRAPSRHRVVVAACRLAAG